MKKLSKRLSVKYKLNYFLFTYRYDIFSISFLLLLLFWYISPLFNKGHIVFSDIDFPADSRGYLEQIFGLWNDRWSSGTLLNLPRLVYISFPWFLSGLFNYSGSIFFKSFLLMILSFSAMSQYVFIRKLIKVYHTREIEFYHTLIIIPGALLYALNPWVIYRIQHIFLLCGYSLFPLLLLFFFNTFDPRFLKQNIKGYSVFHNKLYKRNIFDAAILALILSTMSAGIHYFFYSVLLLFIFLILLIIKTIINNYRLGSVRLFAILFIFLKKGLVFLFFLFIFSFHWLSIYGAGILTGNRPSQFNINVIDTLVLFSRNSSLKNVLYLNSYWWPMFSLNELPLSFYISGGIILAFIVLGILFKSWKHSILFLLSIMAVALIFLSTGVKFEISAEIFILFVTKIPVIGSMFRDPDKLVGILTFSYSCLLVFGIISLGEFLSKKRRVGIIIRFLFLASMVISFFWYLNPYRDRFIRGFYNPVEVPDDYQALNDQFDKDSRDGKVLYIPTSDNMIQSHTGVATPFWNNNEGGFEKPTGDFHVYNSQKDTIFHHEGNIPEVSYYLNYLQYLLDRGISDNIVKHGTVFSIDELIYHKEYKGQEVRQDFNKTILDNQKEIEIKKEMGIFTSYTTFEYPALLRNRGKRIFTPYGLSHLEAYNALDDFSWSNYNVFFTAQQKGSYFNALRPGDFIEMNTFNDILLTSLDKKYYLSPFDYINDGNPFLKWAKTRLNTADWRWYLRSQGIDKNHFDFEPGAGLAVTFASSKLDIPPYKMEKAKGDLLVDFNSLLRIEKFFVPDNPHLFSAQANPISPYNDLPLLHGEIQKGESSDIWQVAKSGLLNVTGDTPYQFRISLSGRGTNKMHVKVRFFDENRNELGITYVIAPSEEISFNGMTLYGEYVSPAAASQMRIDLLSFQRPEQKVYWWIHDIQIFDLWKYRAPNSISMNRYSEKNQDFYFFARAFESIKGGDLKITINKNWEKLINTMSTENGFKWFDLGVVSLNKGDNEVVMENRSGFNTLNTFVLIPVDEYKKMIFPYEQAISRGRQLITAQVESEFLYEGNIQSKRRYPFLQSGDGIRCDKGSLKKDFEIFENGDYDLSIYMGKPEGNKGDLTIRVRDNEGTIQVERVILSDQLIATSISGPEILYDPLKYRDFPRRINSKIYEISSYGPVILKSLPLNKGFYSLELDINSNVTSMASLEDIALFNPSEVQSDFFLEDVLYDTCSECLSITPDMSRKRIGEGILTIYYDKTCSCDWYVYSTGKMEIEEGREYLYDFTARSEKVIKRHTKVLFLNKDDEILGTSYIHEIEEKYKNDFFDYEQIITAPENAEKMIFQIWTRGNKEKNGLFQLKDFKVLAVDSLLIVDSIQILEKEKSALWRPEDNLLVFSEIFSSSWRTNLKKIIDRPIPINSVSTAYLVEESDLIEFYPLFSKLYYTGIVLFPVGIIILLIWLRKKKKG